MFPSGQLDKTVACDSPKLLGSASSGLLPGGIPSPPPCPGWLILAAI